MLPMDTTADNSGPGTADSTIAGLWLECVFLCAGFFIVTLLPASAETTLTKADVCIYGGTSGGVAAAVQVARMGKRAVLIEPTGHLGGMSSSGLGVTDVGPNNTNTYIGGVSREFYKRVGAKYGKSEATWFADKKLWFEPKVAEQVFNDMVAEAGVTVIFNETLDSVVKSGTEITRLVTNTGRIVRAGMFIDATYEGDLLAAAGASWVIGREANSQYGETLNGVMNPADVVSGQTVDPCVIPGKVASGLIPGVLPGPAAAPGSADSLLQAYNYRLCLTNVAANRLPVDPPADYDAAEYELEARYIAAKGSGVTLNNLIDVQQLIPNGKTDINNSGPVSTDLPRGNDGYVTATPAERAAIAARHERYIRGLLYFLKTDPRVPAGVRTEMASWGLCKDEFTDNGGWPRQLYVREARRMVSDFVMTDKHGKGTAVAPDGIGLAAYWLDSHDYQLLNIGGKVQHEGSFFTSSPLYPPAPFPIAFRSIVPKRTEVTNLAAPFCLSASHACFASLRMEPVFMITSQAAATAAVLALDAATPIQDVPYARLRNLLLADAVRLTPTGIGQQAGTPVRGTWVTNVASDALHSKETVRATVERCKKSGLNTIYVVVWNNGLTMYPSDVAKKYIGIIQDPLYKNFDPIREIVEQGHREGLKVHAWFEFGFSYAHPDAKQSLWLQNYPHWAGRNAAGEFLVKDHFYWWNALLPGVQEFLSALVLEVVRKYPVDGIQGDDRLPAMPSEGGYDDYTRALYAGEHGGNQPPVNSKDPDWVQWRADRLSDFARRLYSAVKNERASCIVSWAPGNYPWSRDEYLQDWPAWLKGGYADEVLPQLYRRDAGGYEKLLKELDQQVPAEYKAKVSPGVLIALGDNYRVQQKLLQEMIRLNRAYGFQGECTFFYEGLKMLDPYYCNP